VSPFLLRFIRLHLSVRAATPRFECRPKCRSSRP
jgi:hypothetical protein